MKRGFIRIEAPHFVAGIDIYDKVGHYDYDNKPVPIHRTAPILNYMKGWTLSRIMRYCKVKGWKFIYTEEPDHGKRRKLRKRYL